MSSKRPFRQLEPDTSASPDPQPNSIAGDQNGQPRHGDDRKAYLDSVQVLPSDIRFSSMALDGAILNQLNSAMNRIVHHRIIFDKWGLSEVSSRRTGVAINLFGPPGTGKTTCARAIAGELGRPIIEASYDELESKYVGDTPKNITALFNKASEAKALLFFDEADSILGKRLSSVTHSADHSVNLTRAVMLRQLDSFEGVVVFASNLPANYDKAFVRRIIAHIEFRLPDSELRHRLWKRFVTPKMPVADDLDYEELSATTDGFTGADILNAVELAASFALTKNIDDPRLLKCDFVQAIDHVTTAKRSVGVQLS